MLIISVLHGVLLTTLFSPLISALVLSSTFFFKGSQEQFERATYRLVRFFCLLTFSSSLLTMVVWGLTDTKYGSFSLAHFAVAKDFIINLRFFFDTLSLTFLLTSCFITAIITFFSHRYLHRDPGYRRFFIIISLFSFGINLIILAGTFDLIFAGWEIVGLSSFLLIGYFWHRPKAMAAATRAYYIYRICDLGLLASLLITHFFWHDVSIFGDFLNTQHHSILGHVATPWRWLLSICILLPVLGKSAQFPLSFWLPKAMEGPTHSSAIFYGSLSIHVGVFLLIRTLPIWYYTPGFNYLLGAIGIVTALTASIFALVQSNIKGQIGYASIAQVGLMLFELSLGFTTIAFIHMIGNAFLRCFQLLVSSSILTTHLHMQNVVRSFGELKKFSLPNLLPKRLWPALFVFAINEGFFEIALKKLIVRPILYVSDAINKLLTLSFNKTIKEYVEGDKNPAYEAKGTVMRSISPLIIILSMAIAVDFIFRSSETVRFFSLLTALLLALASLGEKQIAARGIKLAIFANLFALLSVTSNKPGLIYLIGLLTSSAIALEALRHIELRRSVDDLKKHYGLFQQFPLAGTILLLGVLGVVSFPFASTFYGEDILLHLTIGLGLHYLLIFQFIFIISGIALIRIYSLIMFGKRNNNIPDCHLDFTSWGTFARVLLFFSGNILAFILAIS